VWLWNTINLLEPDVIIVGVGVAAVLQPFFSSTIFASGFELVH